MTEKLFDQNAYDTSFSATVVSCTVAEDAGFWQVILNRTLFFPEEGGQEPDEGTLELSGRTPLPVEDVQIKDGIILHKIASAEPPFSPGDVVFGQIDWVHRFDQMQQHTGEHIFSGLVHSIFGYDNVGFHLSRNTVTMDYSGELSAAQIAQLEAAANLAIWEARPVTACYPDADTLASLDYRSKSGIQGDVRIVTIEGIDVCACCAPHVRTTAEVGLLKVVSAIRYKGGMRLTILCGQRAYADYRARQLCLEAISHQLSAPQETLAESVAALKTERDTLLQKVYALQEDALSVRLKTLDPDMKNAVVFAEDLDAIRMRHAVNKMAEAHPGYCGIFCGNEEAGWQYIIGSRQEDSRQMGSLLKERFGARGGGKPEMIQGFVQAKQKELEELFA